MYENFQVSWLVMKLHSEIHILSLFQIAWALFLALYALRLCCAPYSRSTNALQSVKSGLVPGPVPNRKRYSSWRQVGSGWWVRDVLFPFLLQLLRWGWLCCRHLTVLGWWYNTPQRSAVKHQHGRATLQPRVSSLTLPVAVAWLAQRNIAIGIIIAQSCNENRVKQNQTTGECCYSNIVQYKHFHIRMKTYSATELHAITAGYSCTCIYHTHTHTQCAKRKILEWVWMNPN